MAAALVCHSRGVTQLGGTEREGARLSSVVVVDGRRRVRARLAEPVAPPGDGCPVIAFGHGFFQLPALYDSLLAAVASRGYHVVAPDTETGPWPRHRRLADDLWLVARWAGESAGWAGDGAGIVLAGHSMGAGAALLAASLHRGIDAVVTLAAVRTRPPARLEAITAPTLFVVGSQDRIVPPARTRALYEGMPVSVPAQWAIVRGGYHCGFLDGARWRDAGCDRGDLPRQEQLYVTGQLVGDWLDAWIRGGTFSAPPGVDVESRGAGW